MLAYEITLKSGAKLPLFFDDESLCLIDRYKALMAEPNMDPSKSSMQMKNLKGEVIAVFVVGEIAAILRTTGET